MQEEKMNAEKTILDSQNKLNTHSALSTLVQMEKREVEVAGSAEHRVTRLQSFFDSMSRRSSRANDYTFPQKDDMLACKTRLKKEIILCGDTDKGRLQ